jgi:hypothetical protein
MSPKALRALVSGLLVVAAALFAVGVAIERHDNRGEAGGEGHAFTGSVLLADVDQPGSEAGESPARRARERRERTEPRGGRRGRSAPRGGERPESRGETPAERRAESSGEPGGESAAHRARERGGERVFGIDTESTPLVAIAVGVSVLLALAIWLTGSPLALIAVAGFGLVAAAFDVREIFHQLDESRTNLVAIASVVAALHLAAAAGASALLRPRAFRDRPAPGCH